jgi:hypothetical protein
MMWRGNNKFFISQLRCLKALDAHMVAEDEEDGEKCENFFCGFVKKLSFQILKPER